MSTPGSPGGMTKWSRPIPPERGSFPLDHEAQCQPIMKQYLRCLKSHRGVNDDECRQLSKSYLQCRMEKNLMAPDSMRNLGYHDPAAAVAENPTSTSTASGTSTTSANGSSTRMVTMNGKDDTNK